MITFEEAKKKALGLRKDVDTCRENKDAFVFSKKNDVSFGGDGPVAILKGNGRAINMVDYCDISDAEFIQEMSF